MVSTQEKERILGYLARINVPTEDGSLPPPSLNTLAMLQQAHIHSVTFENLDVRRKMEMKIDPDHLFKKIVDGRRGGFCYELNPLFGWILTKLGFNVEYHAGCVASDSDPLAIQSALGIEVDLPEDAAKLKWTGPIHSFMIVTIDGIPYYTDVGFGESPIGPIRLDQFGIPHVFPDTRAFRIVQQGSIDGKPAHYLEYSADAWKSEEKDATWIKRLRWTPEIWTWEEYRPYFEGVITNPESLFVTNTLISKLSLSHRKTIAGKRFLVTEFGGERKKIVTEHSDQELRRILKEHFEMDYFEDEATHPLIF